MRRASGTPGASRRRRTDQQPDEEDHRRKEREQRAERDLCGQPHRVVGEERLERALEHGDPLARRQAPGTARGPCADQRSRPLRARKRIVAPIPPARKKPAPSAPAATTGRFARSLAATFVASPRPSRSCSTASASSRRSRSISRRSVSGVRPFRLVGGHSTFSASRRQLRLPDRLLRHRRRRRLDPAHGEQAEQRGDREAARG